MQHFKRIKPEENDQPEELESVIIEWKRRRWKTPQNTEWGINEQQWEKFPKQKAHFKFHGIKNILRTNGRNVKQPKPQKTNIIELYL